MPLYWIALTLTVLIGIAGGHRPSLPAIIQSASLLPSLSEPLLGIAWTLQFEAVFYVVFAVLIINRRGGQALLAAWFTWIVTGAFGFSTPNIPSSLHGIYCLEFFGGMTVAYLLRRVPIPAPKLLAAGGAVLFIAALSMESAGALDGFGVGARFAYGIPAALLVLGVAAAEQTERVSVPTWLRTLGGAPYSIYLFQFVFIGILWQGWLMAGFANRLPHLLLFAVLSAGAIAGGLMMARFVERPLLLAMRGGGRVWALRQA